MSDPYRNVTDVGAKAAYEQARKLAETARKDIAAAKEYYRAKWARRIVLVFLGVGTAMGSSSVFRACMESASRPAPPIPCQDEVTDMAYSWGTTVRCVNGARMHVVNDRMVHCICPNAPVDGGAD